MLLIDDEVPAHPKAKIFDPLHHSFNPLRNKKKARELAEALYTASPQGENTLTVRNGRRALARGLSEPTRLDNVRVHSPIKGVDEGVEGVLDELLFTDVMRNVVCSDDEFAFTGKNRKIFARLNRAELGDTDCLILGLFLMAHFKGQIVLLYAGFYLRDCHVSLIREERLIAGVNFLGELPPKLRQTALLRSERLPSGTTLQDAETLAEYAGLVPGTIGFTDFVQGAVG